MELRHKTNPFFRFTSICLFVILFVSCKTETQLFGRNLNNPTTISFRNQDGLVVLDSVCVNGTNFPSFIFDTGADICVIDDILVKKLSLKIVGQTNVMDATGLSSLKDVVSIDSLQIGNRRFKNIHAVVYDLSKENCSRVYGIIGNNVIQHGIWKIDFHNNIKTKPPSSQRGVKIPLKFDAEKNLPYLTLKVNRRIFKNFLFDTGSATRLSFSVTDVQYFNVTNQYSYLYKSLNSNELVENTMNQTLIRNAKIGDATIDSCFANFMFNKRFVGNSLFDHTTLTIDYPNKRLLISDKILTFQKQIYKSGFDLDINTAGDVYIRLIRNGSEIQRSGLKIGDVILSINGISADSIKSNIRNKKVIFEILNSDVIEIVLKDSGKTIYCKKKQ